jgi:hypothetical protein
MADDKTDIAKVVSFEGHKAQRFIEKSLLLSYGDPPDSEYQRGFEAGLASIYVECLNGPSHDSRIASVLVRAGFSKRAPNA